LKGISLRVLELPNLLRKFEASLLESWMAEQRDTGNARNLVSEIDLRGQSKEFIQLLQEASTELGAQTGAQAVTLRDIDLENAVFRKMRIFLDGVTVDRAQLGFSPSETAIFIFSFKQSLFAQIRESVPAAAQVDEMWTASTLLDRMGLYVTEAHQKARESVIVRQQLEMLELSTPVMKLWDGVLALPIIGTLDSSRTQTIMESLLERIVFTGAETAIIDITGVPTVDTLTAQHLLKTVTAARLMGAECIISGIRPQIAQTIVHLGVGLGDVITRANLADAFRIALQRSGLAVVKRTLAEPADKRQF
jgi:rsbT co-antagonist protein RsbR